MNDVNREIAEYAGVMLSRMSRLSSAPCALFFALSIVSACLAWCGSLPCAGQAALPRVEAGTQTVNISASALVASLKIDHLGKGYAPLDGSWQFHLGDDPRWAHPALDDSQWEQITADEPWGSQTHPSYEGYAWYRRHIHLSPAQGASPDFALLVPGIDDVFEMYWNGVPVGHLGSFPPRLNWYNLQPPQTYGLGPVRDGVLAVRVLKLPMSSNDDGTAGGFQGTPIIGSPAAIATLKDSLDYQWLRRLQFRMGLVWLYTLAAILSFIAWLRDRRQRLLLWMAILTVMPVSELVLGSLRLPMSSIWNVFLIQSFIQIREISLWFVLLWLLQLNESRMLSRVIRIAAVVALTAGTLDGALGFIVSLLSPIAFQIIDAALTFFILPVEIMPAILVAYAVFRHKRLDSARWMVAIIATTSALYYSVSNIAAQGVRFTHWTLATKMGGIHFTLLGNNLGVQLVIRTLLFLSIIYAVVRYSMENRRRQSQLEQEFQNARELQQVLVPETLPNLPGFALTSAYRPAQEVGGDFFQIIPLEDGSTLLVLGDVSGKGLKAAMAVSLIVGATRMIAEYTTSPAEILSGLNRRLYGRMQGGFVTCVVMRLHADGRCVIASAGHPAPYLNQKELLLPGAFPLGVIFDAQYEETAVRLGVGDHCALYTDGLLEARSHSGELYGFERLETLFATRPNAAQVTEAAVSFGQDDDITVLTLTRLATGKEATAMLSISGSLMS